MSMRAVALVLVLGVGILAYLGWTKYHAPPAGEVTQTQVPADDGTSPHTAGGMDTPDAGLSDPGLAWTSAPRWHKQPDRPMRLATYSIPKAGGDSEDAECALFYFGPGQGGGVDDNIERWIGEFEDATPALRSAAEVGGMSVARVEVSGTYLAHTGSTMGSAGKKPEWKLVGAIVEGPGGRVFCRLTGPTKTVNRARQEFDGMIAGMRRK